MGTLDYKTQKRIIVVDDDASTRASLYAVLTENNYLVTLLDSASLAFEGAVHDRPDAMVLNAALPKLDLTGYCRRLRKEPATKSLVLLVVFPSDNTSERIAALSAGADDCIAKPFDPQEIVYRLERRLKYGAPSSRWPDEGPRARLIAFFGAKGGIGKSTLATNLALALRLRSKKRVLLFDADFAFGVIGVRMNLPTKHTIVDLTEHIEELDPVLLKKVVERDSSGLEVLLAPSQPEESDLVTAAHVEKLLAYLVRLYDYIVVDCPSNYDERTLTVLDMANEIFVITDPEIGTVKNTRFFLDVADRSGLAVDRFQIIINRYNSEAALKPQDIQKALQRPIRYQIATGGRAMIAAANLGVPLVSGKPEHVITRQFLRLADEIIASPPAAVPPTADILAACPASASSPADSGPNES